MNTEQVNHLIEMAKQFLSSSQSTMLAENRELDGKIRHSFFSHPHMFVLCCLMNRQMNSDRAFEIPFRISEHFQSNYDLFDLYSHSEQEYVDLFRQENLHRYNETMAKVFKKGVERIVDQYRGDASYIWRDKPGSAEVVCRFLEFEGCGVKIATMATNLLHRVFEIPFSDYSAIDVSPDVHVQRVMYRLGIINQQENRELAIYAMRGINPSYPGLCDGLFWMIGRDFCDPKKQPGCDHCPLQGICIKRIG